MKLTIFVLTCLFSAAAAASECYLFLPNASSPMCPWGRSEEAAFKAAEKIGLKRDIGKVLAYAAPAECKTDQTKIIRAVEEVGNQGKNITYILLTSVRCKSDGFLANPVHQFPIKVYMWSSHDEKDNADVVATKLYDEVY